MLINPAPDCALEVDWSSRWWSLRVSVAESMLITVASPCQSVSMLSALVPKPNHPFTHSLTHTFNCSLSHTAAIRPTRRSDLYFKTATLPPFGQTNLSPGQDDVPLEKRVH